MKRTTALLMSFILMFSVFTQSAYALGTDEHWATEALEKWNGYQVINGYEDGALKPNQVITKAEMAQIVYNLFDYGKTETQNSYKDVAADDWYANAIEKGLDAGFLVKGKEEKFYPNKELSRTEAAVILYDAFRMGNEDQSLDSDETLKDLDLIAEGAKDKVSFMTAKGYIDGYPDGTFKGSNTITRGEIITIIDRIVGTYVKTDGAVIENETKDNYLVVAEDVSIKNATINGTLFVSEAIGESDFLIENSEVKENLIIEGGGSESIHIKDSVIASVVANKKSGNPLRVSIEGTTTIENLMIEKGMTLENNSKSRIKHVTLGQNISEKDSVDLIGDFESLVINSKDAQINLKGNVKNLVTKGTNTINGKKYGEGNYGSTVTSKDKSTKKSSSSNNRATPWTLVWHDEFSGDTLDTSKWQYETGNWIVDEAGNGISAGWGNEEKQFYTDSEENIYLEDGKLVITAKVEETSDDFGTYDYTSGKLVTNGLFSKKYGKIQARMKLPEGQGLWPAFWMMPEDSVYGDWAASGEIDIMEAAGSKPEQIGGTIHYGGVWPNNTYSGEEYHFDAGEDITDYHVYEIEWEPGEIRWSVDGKLYSTKNNWYSRGEDQTLDYSYPAPFDQEFYMILNLAVGGWYDGDPEDDSVLPASVLVDYVRVYESTRNYEAAEVPAFEPEALPENGKLPLEDGNLIYNNNYDGTQLGDLDPATVYEGIYLDGIDGLDQTDYWYLLTGFNGDASVSINEDLNLAEVDIVVGGNQNYAIQLVQDISLAKGNYYKLSFDAKATSDRDIAVKIGGDENDGWTAYTTEGFSLSTDLESFEHTFQMTEDTDLDARVEFNLGLNTNNVSIGNVRVEAVEPPETDYDASKEPLATDNRVYNGTFDQGDMTRLNYWHLLTTDGKAIPAVDEAARELLVDIKDAGSANDSIQLKQKGIQLNESSEYTLTFDARSEDSRTIAVALMDTENTVEYLETQAMTIDGAMTTYKVEFTTPDVTDHNSELIFNLGGNKADVYLDNVSLVEKTDYVEGTPDLSHVFRENFEALENVTGTPEALNNASVAIHQEAIDGETSLAFKNSAGAWGGFYTNLSETTDVGSYENLVISVKRPEAIDYMQIKPESDEAPGDINLFDYTPEINGEWEMYTVPLKDFAPVDFSELKILGFWNPQSNGEFVETEILLDDLYFEGESTADEDTTTEGAIDITYGLETITFDTEDETLTPWWGDEGSGYSEGEVSTTNGALTVDLTTVGAKSYSPQVFKDGIALENGKTYELSFDAKANASKPININLGKALNDTPWFRNYMPTQTEVLTTGSMITYNYEFTVSEATDENLKLVFELGTINGDATVTEVYFDNISVVEVNNKPEVQYGLETITFDNDEDLLTKYTDNGADLTQMTTGGVLTVDVTGVSDVAYSPKLEKLDLALEKGKTYTISFDAKADDPRKIQLNLGQGLSVDPWFIPYMDAQVINLTGDMVTYSYEFTVSEETSTDLKVAFEFGTVEEDTTTTKVHLDNLSIVEQ